VVADEAALLAIRDLKAGSFLADAAWMVIAALAHNLLRRTTLIGLPDPTIPTARTVRRRLVRRARPYHPNRSPSETPDAGPVARALSVAHAPLITSRSPLPCLVLRAAPQASELPIVDDGGGAQVSDL